VVKAFGARKYEEDKFIQRASAVAKHSYAATRLFASQASLMTFAFTIATLVILWYGGREIAAGQLTEGQLAMFVLYMGILAFPVRMTGWLVNTVSRAISAGQRIFEILDADSPVTEKPGAIVMPKTHGHVRFESVSLSYDSHIPAIHDIDLEVLPGQMVALLGSPGSGKSTIVNLVPRFYEVSSGSVTIDGNDVRDVSLASLRRNIGIVLQDTFAFSATIRDNIAYGVDNASLDDVVSAAKVAQLHEFIRGLPDGYDTWVGERGVTLSGGQRQRLAIARTILLSPPILILDDSTSSVDMATEHMIQKAFEEVVKGRTTFVIAHRLSTIRKADQILVLDQGGIMERGTHQELLSRKGYYRRIYDLQLGASVENLANDLTYIPGDDAE
jgi:ATP-binding cassette subfamily B protein